MPARNLRRLPLVLSLAASVLIAGAAPAWPLAGGLDPSFGGDGVVHTVVRDGSYGEDVLLQDDGKLVVAGFTTLSGQPHLPVLVRYLPDGGLDPGFDDDGVFIPALDGLTGGMLEAVAAGPAGTLVVGGTGCVGTEPTVCSLALVVRLTSDGSPDPTFGAGDGYVTLPGVGTINDVEVRGDGGVVALTGPGVIALEADGQPDPGFGGGDGVAELVPPLLGRDLVLDGAGRAVVAGGQFPSQDLWVERLEADGDIDPSFSPGGTDGSGVLRMDLGPATGVANPADAATTVILDGGGRVLVGGVTQRSDTRPQLFVLRLGTAGAVDTTFSGDGVALNDRPSRTSSILGLAVQPDGAIAFGGAASDFAEGTTEVMAGRFLSNGSPDPSFGGGGIVSYDVGVANIGLGGMALQDDGAIVVPARLGDFGLGQLHMGAVRFIGDDPCTQNGTPGADTLTGTSGPDVLCGLGGNDVLLGKGGNDVLVGGPGLDTASFAGAGTVITANLATGTATGQGSDTLDGIERLLGGTKADKLTGNAAANTLTGGAGADTLNGGGGADSLLGSDGNDILNGGAGNDSLNGGPGTDDCNQGAGTGPKTGCET
jgi:uncharacterized delta-60 repeat protein